MKDKIHKMEINNIHNLIIVLTDKCVGLGRQAEHYKLKAETLEEQNAYLLKKSNDLYQFLLNSGFTREQIEKELE